MFPFSFIFFTFLLTLIVRSKCLDPVDTNNLVAVAVLYRHGDRSVLGSYPNDPYHDESYWPEGYGELLDAGKLRHYNLGKWLRNRYGKFLSKEYVKKEITVQSSNVDRCLMSASSNLAGLYRPIETDMFAKDLQWVPVPVHTTPEEDDPYLAMNKPCPRQEKLVKELIQNDEFFKNLPVEYQEEYDILAKNTGWNVTISNFQGLYTTFYVYAMHNKSFLPKWAYSLNREKFTYLAGLSMASKTYTDTLKTLKAGPLFGKLLGFFDKARNSTAEPKFLMLSAHDGTVVAALQTMNVYDFVIPEFTATVIWELHKYSNGGHYMKLYYKRPSGEIELKLSGCKGSCEYTDFSSFVGQYVRDGKSWENLCRLSNSNTHDYP